MTPLPAHQQAVIDRLVVRFFEDPNEGEKLAREYGLWDYLRKTLKHQVWLALCRTDPNAFIEHILVDPETGEHVHQQPFHVEWQALISQQRSRTMIVCPRGHGKTMQVVGRTVWEIGRDPNIRTRIVSSKDEKAKEILGAVRDLIKNSDRVKEVFPNLIIDEARGDTKSDFYVKRSNVSMRDPTCQAAGVLTAGAGSRADILLCDDVVDPKNAMINPALREQVKTMLSSTWFSTVSPQKGRIIYLATPYHVQDATHHLRETMGDKWTVWWIPAVRYEKLVDEDNKPIMIPDPEQDGKEMQAVKEIYLWPEKWDKEALETKRAELGPKAYASQFLLQAMSDEDRTFPEQSLERSYNKDLAFIGEGIEPDWPTFGGVDLASTFGKRSAWTVILTLARNPTNGKLRIKSLMRRKLNFSQTIPYIVSEFQAHKWRALYVESNQYQTAVVSALDENHKSIPVKAFQTGTNKNDELVGLPGLNVAFDQGLFEIPAARFPLAPDDTSDLGILMSELQTYPGGESKDVVMALWFAYRAAIENKGDFEDAYTACLAM